MMLLVRCTSQSCGSSVGTQEREVEGEEEEMGGGRRFRGRREEERKGGGGEPGVEKEEEEGGGGRRGRQKSRWKEKEMGTQEEEGA